MAEFKVKSKERQALARALSREIRGLGLVDTRTLMDGVRIAAEGSNVQLNTINIRVVAPYYYLFQDMGTGVQSISPVGGAAGWNGVPAQRITQKWTEGSDFKAVIETIVQQYIDWSIENFPILEVARFMDNPKIQIGFSFFGDPSGKWNIDIAPSSF